VLSTYTRGALLGERSQFRELLVELSLSGELEHQEDALVIVEEAIKPEDVRVSGKEEHRFIVSTRGLPGR
jgi:hypothetical protein